MCLYPSTTRILVSDIFFCLVGCNVNLYQSLNDPFVRHSFVSLSLHMDRQTSDFFLILVYAFVPFSVNELTDGSSWHTLATTVGIYVLLKFLQGGGAGKIYLFVFWMDNVESELCSVTERCINPLKVILYIDSQMTCPLMSSFSVLFTHIFAFSQVPRASSVTCALSCGSRCSSSPTAWFRCVFSPTCTPSRCAGT